MIGVIAPDSDPRVISEFFELFKTPWEHFRPGRRYDVILCVGDAEVDCAAAHLIVCYADRPLSIDSQEAVDARLHEKSELLLHNGRSLVVYGKHLTFDRKSGVDEGVDGSRLVYRSLYKGVRLNRIGYDLFAEIAELLTNGQPAEFAQFPTIDIHIALLREMVVESGVELVEIPPVPEGYGCIACLTHDIDHPAIKNHRWDSTAFGFLLRATAGSIVQFLRGRITVRSLAENWAAALKLPLVYAGLAEDFWSGFEERYFRDDRGFPSTYFVIPFRDYAGKDLNGVAPKIRAARYGANEIKSALQRISSKGCEVGLHGIDAWHDQESAEKELNEVRKFTGDTEVGVRMHWLFFDRMSPRVLEEAGASFDSTMGYRETVGFRSGTAQAYRPLSAERLLELPLHVMDTALFYPAYLGCSQKEAQHLVCAAVEAVAEFGGCLTVNWHDRSIAPERNWQSCYHALLDDLTARNAWFATAGEATAWFRMRRSVVFESGESSSMKKVMVPESREECRNLPPLQVRSHNSSEISSPPRSENSKISYLESAVCGTSKISEGVRR